MRIEILRRDFKHPKIYIEKQSFSYRLHRLLVCSFAFSVNSFRSIFKWCDLKIVEIALRESWWENLYCTNSEATTKAIFGIDFVSDVLKNNIITIIFHKMTKQFSRKYKFPSWLDFPRVFVFHMETRSFNESKRGQMRS